MNFMPDLRFETLLKNQKEWVQKKLGKDPGYFDKLAQGQSPLGLFIACSDSRITIEDMMGAKPGDIFSLRNISNVVSNDDLSGLSVIEYAVSYLKVPHIIICGHYDCGGIQAAMTPEYHGLLSPWLVKIKEVYSIHRQELNAIQDEHRRFDRLVELNVYEQCRNTMKIRSVQKALVAEEIQLYGWVFDMKSGYINDLGFDMKMMRKEVMEVYNLLG